MAKVKTQIDDRGTIDYLSDDPYLPLVNVEGEIYAHNISTSTITASGFYTDVFQIGTHSFVNLDATYFTSSYGKFTTQMSAAQIVGDGFNITNIDGSNVVYNNTVIVQNASDLPAIISGSITLASNTKYMLFGPVVVPDNTKVFCPISTAIVGHNAPTDQLIGNVNDVFVTVVDDGTYATNHIYFCTVQNTNTGSSSIGIRAIANPNSSVVIQECRVLCSGLIGIDGDTAQSLKIANSTITGKDGIHVHYGVDSILFQNSSAQALGTTGSAIHIFSGSAFDIVTFQNSATIGLLPTQYGVTIETGVTYGRFNFESVYHYGSSLFNNGWDQTLPGISVINCPSLPNSATGGGSSLTASLPTITNSIGVWQDIRNGANLHALDAGSERFDLSSSLNGEIRYIGTRSRKVQVYGGASFAMASGGTNTIRIGLFRNNQLVSTTVADTDTQSGRYSSVSIIPVLLLAAPNDTFKLRFMNVDSSTNVIFQSAGINVAALGF